VIYRERSAHGFRAQEVTPNCLAEVLRMIHIEKKLIAEFGATPCSPARRPSTGPLFKPAESEKTSPHSLRKLG